MSRAIEDKAKEYLIKHFNHPRYRFTNKSFGERGFDLWMSDEILAGNVKVELKATGGKYGRRRDIFQKLVFSAENEVESFKQGDTKVVRVFLGDTPPKVFLFDRSVFQDGAQFEKEFRAKIVGRINYRNVTEINSEAMQ
jgi:hypothetical protein